MSEFPSCLRLDNIPLCVSTTFCLSIHPLMNIWVTSTFRLLWIMLPWALIYKCPFDSQFSIISGIYPEVELMGHMVFLFLVFWEPTILFSLAAVPFCIPTNITRGFQFLHILIAFVIFWVWVFNSGYPNECVRRLILTLWLSAWCGRNGWSRGLLPRTLLGSSFPCLFSVLGTWYSQNKLQTFPERMVIWAYKYMWHTLN